MLPGISRIISMKNPLMLAKNRVGKSKNEKKKQLELSKGHCNGSLCRLKNGNCTVNMFIGQKGISTDNITCIIYLNPLMPNGNNSYRILEILFLKKEVIIEKTTMSATTSMSRKTKRAYLTLYIFKIYIFLYKYLTPIYISKFDRKMLLGY